MVRQRRGGAPGAPGLALTRGRDGPLPRGTRGNVFGLVAGVGLLVFARPTWALGIGALSLLACAVAVFALSATPD